MLNGCLTKTLASLFLFVAATFCFADMTIYLKDGSHRQVHKIVFKDTQADLYLLDGTLLTLPVSSIDLESSGIGAPVGTYGETKITGRKTTFRRGVPVADGALRLEELKKQWEDATITAKALKDIGSIRRGDVVRALPYASQQQPEKKKKYYSDYNEEERPANPDQAYIIIYRTPDGLFGKKILDAATFALSFEILKSPPVSAPPGALPVSPPVSEPPPASETEQKPAETTAVPPVETPAQTEDTGDVSTAEAQPEERSIAGLAMILVAAGVVLAAVAAVLLMKKRPKPFVDTSRFAQYERDLREFEMEIWLKHGKSADQLMEVCLKKFYQDNPAALNINMKIWKGEQKNWILPLLLKQSGKSGSEVEAIYNDFVQRQERIRKIIQEVSARVGLQTVRPAAPQEITGPTVPKVTATTASAPRVKEPEPSAAGPASVPGRGSTSSLEAPVSQISVPDEPFPLHQEKKKQAPSYSDLPSYAATVLAQLSSLTSKEED